VGTGGGGDCPWYKSTTGEEHCVSSADFAGIHALSATPTECCHRHFTNVDTATCVMNSLADIVVVQAKDVYDLQRIKYYYPTLLTLYYQLCTISITYIMLDIRIKSFICSTHQRCVVVPGTPQVRVVQTLPR
jgi:hypothetical protein